jgi:kynurenine formamidase
MTTDFRALGAELSNWGRWGDGDERGTLNFITSDVIAAATTSIRTGETFELSIPVCSDGPQRGDLNRINPVHLMSVLPTDTGSDGVCVADDYLVLPLQSGTQWDSLAHLGYDGTFYNGVAASTVTARGGAQLNAIDRLLPGIVGRGVLLDVARFRNVDHLDAGDGITPGELDDICQTQGVEPRSGDIVLVRTGWRRKSIRDGWAGWRDGEPGLVTDCARWLHEHEIAAVASDNWALEQVPSPDGRFPLHCVLLRDMGMIVGEIFDMEDLAHACDADRRWDFFFVGAPLRVPHAVGSPVSPIAIR